MEFETIRATFSSTFLQILNGALATAPVNPLIDTPSIQLYTDGPSPITQTMVAADFTEATFPGYAAVAAILPVAPPVNIPSGLGIGRLISGLFVCTGTASENIQGYYVVDTGNNVILAEAFPAPVPIANYGDYINLTVLFSFLFAPQSN